MNSRTIINCKTHLRKIASLLVVAVALFLSPRANAQASSQWIANTGDWGNPFNWNPEGIPAGSAVINQGNATISTGENFTVNAVEMATTAHSTAVVTISGGGTLTTAFAYLANTTTSTATINIMGAGSSLTVNRFLGADQGGTATINVSKGASLITNGEVVIPSELTTQGSINLDGAGSKWIATGRSIIAGQGPGFLTITNGAQFTSTGEIFIGFTKEHIAQGTITIGLSPVNLTASSNSGNVTAKLVPITTTDQVGIGTGILQIINEYRPAKGDKATLISAAGGITGTFSNTTNNSYVSLWNITYDANNVYAAYTGNSLLQTMPGLNPNQFKLAVVLDTELGNGYLGALGAALSGLGDKDLENALNELSPLKLESFASSAGINNSSFLTQNIDEYLARHRGPQGQFIANNNGLDYSGLAMNDNNYLPGLQGIHSRMLAWNPAPTHGLLSDSAPSMLGAFEGKESGGIPVPMKPQSQAKPWQVFVNGSVVLAQNFADPTAGLPFSSSTTGGVGVGADYLITPHFLIGGLFNYANTQATLDTIGSTSTIDTFAPGIFASYSDSGWFANGLFSYGFNNYVQKRNVAIGAVNGQAYSAPSGSQLVTDLDGGYDFHGKGGWTYGPTAGLQYVHLNVNGFTETGLPAADLTVGQNTSDSIRSRLGGRVSNSWKTNGLEFTPHLDLSWQHEFLDQNRGVTGQFTSGGGATFILNTPNPSRDSAIIEFGTDAQINDALDLFVDYTAQAGQSNYFGQAVQAGVKIGF